MIIASLSNYVFHTMTVTQGQRSWPSECLQEEIQMYLVMNFFPLKFSLLNLPVSIWSYLLSFKPTGSVLAELPESVATLVLNYDRAVFF